VADRVFDELLGAILRGELKPDSPLPTQRELSTQFAVSPLIVRQAIHRLEELELVRVRQGSTTIVLDPNEAADVRLIQLQLEVAQPGDALALAGIENRALMTIPMLVLAERRITPAELRTLDALVESLRATSSPTPEQLGAFIAQYWALIAASTRNPLLRHQVRWWFKASRGFAATNMRRPVPSPEFFRELNDALRKRSGAAALWIGKVNLLCDWTEAQPGHTYAQERAARPRRTTGSASTSSTARAKSKRRS
jgi:DNA-binding FadR family transcriptional regulator